MHDYRPISCCNTIYKCISKIIAARIKGCLPDIISPAQTAFVQGRSIADNILSQSGLWAGLWGVVTLPGMWVGLCFFCFAFLGCSWFFWAVAFPSIFRGGSARFSVFLGLGLVYSLVVWLRLLEINAYLSKKKTIT